MFNSCFYIMKFLVLKYFEIKITLWDLNVKLNGILNECYTNAMPNEMLKEMYHLKEKHLLKCYISKINVITQKIFQK